MGENAILTAVPMISQPPQVSFAGDKILARAELPLQMITSGGCGIPMVTELENLGPVEPDPMRPSLILRRAGSDSLWEIAKAAGSTMELIRSANGFAEEPRPGQMLLITVT